MEAVICTVVFTYGQEGGNPCPAVWNAERYTTEEMQATTKAFMQQSAFVCPVERPACGFKLRHYGDAHQGPRRADLTWPPA